MSSSTHKMMKTIHFIINPASGRTEPILSIVNAAMKEAGIQWDVSITKEKGDGLQLAKAAVKQGPDIVGVYGGDGTIMEVMSGLMGSETPLAILPGGSANVLANEINIPMDLKEACKLICEGPSKLRTKDIKISVSPKQKAECDGEVLETMPSRIKVVPAAIKVLVPQEDKKVP